MTTLTDAMADKVQSSAVTESRLALLQEGDTVKLANEESSDVLGYTFIGSRGKDDFRLARRKSFNSIVGVSLSPSNVSLYADNVYRGRFLEFTFTAGEDTSYLEYDEILRRFSR